MYDIFSLPDVIFPDGFLWGSGTAGHQIEGDNFLSHRWRIEQGYTEENRSGKACNHYELYREDAALLKELGHQCYRFSLEWCRIQPAPDRWDDKALEHYLDELQELKKNGLKTMVTLCHISMPAWFVDKGDFRKRENIAYFTKYVEYVVPKITPYVDYWNVLNEFFSYMRGSMVFTFNSIRAHSLAYHIIKRYSDAPVSSAHMALQHYPNRFYDRLDNLTAALNDFRQHETLLHAIRHGELIGPEIDAEECPEAKGAMDFWALNIYTRHLVNSRKADLSAERFPHKKLKMIDMDFYLEEMYPEGTTAMLERFADRPVFITENGCACEDDDFRIVYMILYLSALNDAIRRGVDLRGYLYWSLLDNYEWISFKPRFGLVGVDFKTFRRIPKRSAFFFRDIIRANGFNQEIIRKYLAQMPSLSDIKPRS
jgi:beta-glucosidase